MKKGKNKKVAGATTFIGKSDGPTSVFLLNKEDAKRTLKQELQKKRFALRKMWITKTLKADPHTMEQVIAYAKKKWGYVAVSKNSETYRTEYKQMRASFLLMYKPELLGSLKEHPTLEGQDEDSIKRFMELNEKRQKAAEQIPVELFDIDLCILKQKKRNFQSRLVFEKNYGYIGGSASGQSDHEMKRYHRAYRDIYKYYGVAQSDIDNRTKRYEDVVRTLAMR